MTYLLLTLALAAPPQAVVTDSGAVEGTVSLPVPPSQVMKDLEDPAWVTTVSGDRTTVSVKGRQGACTTAAYESPNVIMTARYTVSQCRKDDGYEATLVESPTFDAYRTRWTVAPEGAGTLLHYHVALDPKISVPDWIVRSSTRKAVQKMLENIAAAYAAK